MIRWRRTPSAVFPSVLGGSVCGAAAGKVRAEAGRQSFMTTCIHGAVDGSQTGFGLGDLKQGVQKRREDGFPFQVESADAGVDDSVPILRMDGANPGPGSSPEFDEGACEEVGAGRWWKSSRGAGRERATRRWSENKGRLEGRGLGSIAVGSGSLPGSGRALQSVCPAPPFRVDESGGRAAGPGCGASLQTRSAPPGAKPRTGHRRSAIRVWRTKREFVIGWPGQQKATCQKSLANGRSGRP